mgnify:FL=1
MLMSSAEKTATLHYLPNGFHVIKPGNHVLCAVSGAPVPLETLRYWCAVRQEAYAGCEESTRRLTGQG